MSYCRKITDNKIDSVIDILFLREMLNIDSEDSAFDVKILFYLSAAISYIENTYDIVIVKNTFSCCYNKDYFNLPRYNTPNGVEIVLPNPVVQIFNVQYVNEGVNIAEFTAVPEKYEIYYLKDKNILRFPWCDYLSLDYYELKPFFYLYWGCTEYIEVISQLGYDKDTIPADLLQVLLSLVSEMFNNNGSCDCAKLCENSINSKILSNYTNLIG